MIKKIKVGFYVYNKHYPNVDLRFPEQGNPGIGGSEFTELATAYYLNKLYSEKIEVLVIANIIDLLPPSLNVYHADNIVDAAEKSERQGCDIFVFRTVLWTEELYQKLGQLNIKAIARSTNYFNIHALNQITDCSKIKGHVCTGQEQLDILRDHKLFNKSIRIFDPFNIEHFVPKHEILKQGNTVVFIGSLVFSKGFHVLARVWSDIIKEKPEAKLIVIGSGKLYDRNQKLGKWGIAEESYEANYIRPFLSDENGKLIESVHFAGLLGMEKIEILQNADVGVVNPTGATEVCPASALEIQACGTPVVSVAKLGLLDTVVHQKTGLLGKSDKDLTKNILYLLNNPQVAKQFGENGINFVRENFDYQFIVKQWLELLIDIYNDKPPQPQPMKQNYFYNAKFLVEGLRIIKKYIPLLRNFPALFEIAMYASWLKKLR
ncbi:glycosyltransferase family 4 protein [Anabaena sp. 4-3]|uniref:glycosyltransferase family 4 protein n=1 Tax=Anabaena sp. 4-3 TaxID=1811979 RepID=UPI00082954C4|nr:glycosyltransferase family 4 protein [Anabaena sp. 4-3]